MKYYFANYQRFTKTIIIIKVDYFSMQTTTFKPLFLTF